MSYHASVNMSIGFRSTQDLVQELQYSGCLPYQVTYHMEETAWWISCRDSKRIVDAIEAWMKIWPRIDGLCGQLDPWKIINMGILHQVLKDDFGRYINGVMLKHRLSGKELTGKERKQAVWKACAEYQFVFC